MRTLGEIPEIVTAIRVKARKYALVAVASQTLLLEGGLGVSRNTSHYLARDLLYKPGRIGVRRRVYCGSFAADAANWVLIRIKS